MSDATLPGRSVPHRVAPSRLPDLLVFLAVTLVSIAVATALHLHLDLPLAAVFAAGLALHLLLLGLHMRMALPAARGRPSRAAAAPQALDGSVEVPRADADRRGRPESVERRLPEAGAAPSSAPVHDEPVLDLRGPVLPPAARAAPPEGTPVAVVHEPVASQPPPAAAAAFDEILRDLARTLEAHARPDVTDLEPVSGGAASTIRPPTEAQEQIIARSVAALRATGEAMQAYEDRPAGMGAGRPAARGTTSAPTAARSPSQAALGEIADAIEAERVELAVSPIVGLNEQRLHHHEMVMRLNTMSGDVLVPQGIASVARGSGLIPLLDALKTGRAIRLAQMFEVAGETGAVFCRVTGEGLMSKRVVRALTGEPGSQPPAATRVVLTFIQSEVRMFGHAHWTALADLADQGFRFCVSDITDLDLDFQTMRNVGFLFARVEARILLAGLQVKAGFVPANEVGRFLSAAGLTLIADQLDHETLIGPMRDCGVHLGQGALLGRLQTVMLDRAA